MFIWSELVYEVNLLPYLVTSTCLLLLVNLTSMLSRVFIFCYRKCLLVMLAHYLMKIPYHAAVIWPLKSISLLGIVGSGRVYLFSQLVCSLCLLPIFIWLQPQSNRPFVLTCSLPSPATFAAGVLLILLEGHDCLIPQNCPFSCSYKLLMWRYWILSPCPNLWSVLCCLVWICFKLKYF
jgi:hypothetical protein